MSDLQEHANRKHVGIIIDPLIERNTEVMRTYILEFLIEMSNKCSIHIFSYTNRGFFGRYINKKWIIERYMTFIGKYPDDSPEWLRSYLLKYAFTINWRKEARYVIEQFVNNLNFPKRKFPVTFMIDESDFMDYKLLYTKLNKIKKEFEIIL